MGSSPRPEAGPGAAAVALEAAAREAAAGERTSRERASGGREETGPAAVVPGTDAPGTDIPGTDIPGTDTPGTNAPRTSASGANEAVAQVTSRVSEVLEGVFGAVEETRADTAGLLARLAGESRRPVTADLAALRPGLRGRLTRLGPVSGMGFVAAPGLLADVQVWLEWWQTGADGEVQPLLLDLDPAHSAYADYTHWEWFGLARDTGRRAVVGPYVDYLCSDEYSLTLSVPVTVEGRFAGVAAADVYLPHFEAELMPVMQRLPWPACLVNAQGRVAVSTDARYLTGSLLKGRDFAPPAGGGRRDGHGGGREDGGGSGPADSSSVSLPCGDLPLVLTRCPG